MDREALIAQKVSIGFDFAHTFPTAKHALESEMDDSLKISRL